MSCDIYSSRSSILGTARYELTAFYCSILVSAWLPTELAVKVAIISYVAACDDYHTFTLLEPKTRADMIAFAVRAACELDGQMASILINGTASQVLGTGRI